MTKRRAALTFEHALTQIAAEIGWDRVAELAGQAERTVRSWSDPDTGPAAGGAISLDLALGLDVAYRAAGGAGAPMLQCLATRIELDTADACQDLALLNHKIAKAAREGGQAIAAAITAAQPGAPDSAIAIAEAEIEESIAAHTDTLVTLRAGRRVGVEKGGGQEGTLAATTPGRGNQWHD